jgi:hypothetical protein
MSAGHIDHLLDIWAAGQIISDTTNNPFFSNTSGMEARIDEIREGACPWYTYLFRYSGPLNENSKGWKDETYILHTRNALDVSKNIAGNPDFAKKWDYVPYEEYTSPNNRRFCHPFSGRKAWRDAVSPP